MPQTSRNNFTSSARKGASPGNKRSLAMGSCSYGATASGYAHCPLELLSSSASAEKPLKSPLDGSAEDPLKASTDGRARTNAELAAPTVCDKVLGAAAILDHLSTGNSAQPQRRPAAGAASLLHNIARVDHFHREHAAAEPRLPVRRGRGGVTKPFPVKLHQMLEKVEADGLTDVVSWQPHGRCFVVHQPAEFVDRVMPKYFGKQSQFSSFQRQLNLYGFTRLTTGLDRNGYYHKLFVRDKPELCDEIRRTRVKGTGVRMPAKPDEPNFYADGAESIAGRHNKKGVKILNKLGTEVCRDASSPVKQEVRFHVEYYNHAQNAKARQSGESETSVKKQSLPRQLTKAPLVSSVFEEAFGEYLKGTPAMEANACQPEKSESSVQKQSPPQQLTKTSQVEIPRSTKIGAGDLKDASSLTHKDARGEYHKGAHAMEANACQPEKSESRVQKQSPPQQLTKTPLVNSQDVEVPRSTKVRAEDLSIPSSLTQKDACGEYRKGAHAMVANACQPEESESSVQKQSPPQQQTPRSLTTPFPLKLHQMLEKVEADGLADVVSWQPHGRCFVIHKPKEFAKKVMPKHFKNSKFASFQRQLNLYNFTRMKYGLDRGGYYHKLFVRDKPELCREIHRVRVKGTGVRVASGPEEPNFYADGGNGEDRGQDMEGHEGRSGGSQGCFFVDALMLQQMRKGHADNTAKALMRMRGVSIGSRTDTC